jgi:hypothetical protein
MNLTNGKTIPTNKKIVIIIHDGGQDYILPAGVVIHENGEDITFDTGNSLPDYVELLETER